MATTREALGALNCPTQVTWADVKDFFGPGDIAHMKAATGDQLDLSDYDSVIVWAHKIYEYVANHYMPPPPNAPWSDAWIQTFGCWVQQGCKPAP